MNTTNNSSGSGGSGSNSNSNNNNSSSSSRSNNRNWRGSDSYSKSSSISNSIPILINDIFNVTALADMSTLSQQQQYHQQQKKHNQHQQHGCTSPSSSPPKSSSSLSTKSTSSSSSSSLLSTSPSSTLRKSSDQLTSLFLPPTMNFVHSSHLGQSTTISAMLTTTTSTNAPTFLPTPSAGGGSSIVRSTSPSSAMFGSSLDNSSNNSSDTLQPPRTPTSTSLSQTSPASSTRHSPKHSPRSSGIVSSPRSMSTPNIMSIPPNSATSLLSSPRTVSPNHAQQQQSQQSNPSPSPKTKPIQFQLSTAGSRTRFTNQDELKELKRRTSAPTPIVPGSTSANLHNTFGKINEEISNDIEEDDNVVASDGEDESDYSSYSDDDDVDVDDGDESDYSSSSSAELSKDDIKSTNNSAAVSTGTGTGGNNNTILKSMFQLHLSGLSQDGTGQQQPQQQQQRVKFSGGTKGDAERSPRKLNQSQSTSSILSGWNKSIELIHSDLKKQQQLQTSPHSSNSVQESDDNVQVGSSCEFDLSNPKITLIVKPPTDETVVVVGPGSSSSSGEQPLFSAPLKQQGLPPKPLPQVVSSLVPPSATSVDGEPKKYKSSRHPLVRGSSAPVIRNTAQRKTSLLDISINNRLQQNKLSTPTSSNASSANSTASVSPQHQPQPQPQVQPQTQAQPQQSNKNPTFMGQSPQQQHKPVSAQSEMSDEFFELHVRDIAADPEKKRLLMEYMMRMKLMPTSHAKTDKQQQQQQQQDDSMLLVTPPLSAAAPPTSKSQYHPLQSRKSTSNIHSGLGGLGFGSQHSGDGGIKSSSQSSTSSSASSDSPSRSQSPSPRSHLGADGIKVFPGDSDTPDLRNPRERPSAIRKRSEPSLISPLSLTPRKTGRLSLSPSLDLASSNTTPTSTSSSSSTTVPPPPAGGATKLELPTVSAAPTTSSRPTVSRRLSGNINRHLTTPLSTITLPSSKSEAVAALLSTANAPTPRRPETQSNEPTTTPTTTTSTTPSIEIHQHHHHQQQQQPNVHDLVEPSNQATSLSFSPERLVYHHHQQSMLANKSLSPTHMSLSTGGTNNNTMSSESSPHSSTDSSVFVATKPSGKVMTLTLLSNWGDSNYIGLSGIDMFDYAGDYITLKDISTQLRCQPPPGDDIAKIIDRCPRTLDDLHLWQAPFQESSIVQTSITVIFDSVLTLSMIRIWNYNKSRIHSARGVKDMEIRLDNQLIFKGSIKRAPGSLRECDECAEYILFTNEEVVLQTIEQNDPFSPSQFQEEEFDHEDSSSPDPNVGDQLKVRDLNPHMEHLFSRINFEREGKLSSRRASESDFTVSRLEHLPQQTSHQIAGNDGCYEEINVSSLPKGRRIKFHFKSTWGDKCYLGLTSIQVYDQNYKLIKLTMQNLSAYPKDINDIPGHSGDYRTLDKLIDGHNLTMNDQHMWLIPLFHQHHIHKGTEQDQLERHLTIDLGQATSISCIRVWNYNKSQEDAARGAKHVDITLDGQKLSPEGFIFRKAPGNDLYDFGQVISFVHFDKHPVKLEPFERQLTLPKSVYIPQDYQTLQLPTGFIIKIVIVSSWGDTSYVGLNGIQLYDWNGLAFKPSPSNVVITNGNDRLIERLFDGVNNSYDERHSWTTQVHHLSDHSTTFIPVSICIYFDYPVSLSMVKFWNYSRMLQRGVQEFEIHLDDYLIFKGKLSPAPAHPSSSSSLNNLAVNTTSSTSPPTGVAGAGVGGGDSSPPTNSPGATVDWSQTILFSHHNEHLQKEKIYRYTKMEQVVQFINNGLVIPSSRRHPQHYHQQTTGHKQLSSPFNH
ncbi:hypothetical protein SAMD00019534_106550 [Acytostelium subglobosum LB1]|uniref:hypothetical protein n=1 Tax=Acytostelium subglobosum LB1 TaxID=1410327 RepID=UPI0006448FCC|nr:hypothetical protein SAMD00019534_106550 [Acytostelium subglobosum LB1]GAM27479.1 hypothetical protein SAMD00019534_106550 [Acytostelium subglobosum LB1]|eukprot:XP_012749544.1 hypothetical protein SAMD00019534_106550 [Acytostelium subglobosum LB1]